MPDQTEKDLAKVIAPAPGKLLIQVKNPEEINRSGLYLTESTIKELQGGARPTQGIVIAVGDDDMEEPVCFVAVGDRVIIGKYSGIEMTFGRTQRVILLKHSDILAKYLDPDAPDVKIKE